MKHSSVFSSFIGVSFQLGFRVSLFIDDTNTPYVDPQMSTQVVVVGSLGESMPYYLQVGATDPAAQIWSPVNASDAVSTSTLQFSINERIVKTTSDDYTESINYDEEGIVDNKFTHRINLLWRPTAL